MACVIILCILFPGVDQNLSCLLMRALHFVLILALKSSPSSGLGLYTYFCIWRPLNTFVIPFLPKEFLCLLIAQLTSICSRSTKADYELKKQELSN